MRSKRGDHEAFLLPLTKNLPQTKPRGGTSTLPHYQTHDPTATLASPKHKLCQRRLLRNPDALLDAMRKSRGG